MPKRWLALSTTKDTVTVVDAEIPDDDDDPIVIMMDDSWRVQKGGRAEAYNVLHQQCADYVRENKLDAVFVKASAVMGRGSARLGLLTGAEVRGVVMAASGGLCPTSELAKSVVSRTYGDRTRRRRGTAIISLTKFGKGALRDLNGLSTTPVWVPTVASGLVSWEQLKGARRILVEWKRHSPRKHEWRAVSEPVDAGQKRTLGSSGGLISGGQAVRELEAFFRT